LGATIDTEVNGQPNLPATGDDTNLLGGPGTPFPPGDEDGVVPTPGVNWTPFSNNGSVNVTVTGGPACLSAWIDWENDGDLTNNFNYVIQNRLVPNGSSTQTFLVGGNPFPGSVYARFRLYDPDRDASQNPVCTTPRVPTGLAENGEVEDYRWEFGPLAVTLSRLQAAQLSPVEQVLALVRSWLQ
jgi:hypothetical protein